MQNKKEEASMKYNDTYSMIGAMINLGFEVEFKKEREKKRKTPQIFTQIDCHDISIKEAFGKYYREYVRQCR